MSHNQQEFASRFEKAQQHGWSIVKIGNIMTIRAPFHFACEKNNWSANYETIAYNDQDIWVPHWFWNNNVLETGSW
jgi:hypothetical protein